MHRRPDPFLVRVKRLFPRLAVVILLLSSFHLCAAPIDQYFYEGYMAETHGDYDRAIPDWDEVLRFNCGNMFRWQKGALNAAITDYTLAIRLNPSDGEAFIARAEVCGDQTNFDLALADYNAALQLEPSNADYHFNRGSFQYRMTNYAATAVDYDEAVRLAPTKVDYWSAQGRFREQMTNYDGASRISAGASDGNPPTLSIMLTALGRRKIRQRPGCARRIGTSGLKPWIRRAMAWTRQRPWTPIIFWSWAGLRAERTSLKMP
jgi:tetratricopeptide (TPR) repeat protein